MKILFLDLEDTIITPAFEGWHLCELINVDKINAFIKHHNIELINIFSFAIHNQREKELFIKHNRAMIENALGMPLFEIPTMDDQIIPHCCKQKGIHITTLDFADVVSFWSKDISFILFLKEKYKNNQHPHEIFFLDDAIDDMNFSFPKLNFTAQCFNIDTLEMLK